MKVIVLVFILFVCINFALAGFHHSAGLQKNWDGAKSYCESHGMVLAKLNSEKVNKAAIDYIKNRAKDVWIGLKIFGDSKPFSYRWADGQEATYMYWRGGITFCNTRRRKKRCVKLGKSGTILSYSDFKFCNSKCSDNYEFLCTGPLPSVESLNVSSIMVSFKRSLTLVCSYESSVTVTKIYWRIVTTSISTQVDVDVTGNDGTAVYTTDKFEKEGVGSYQCFVENMTGTSKGNAIELSLMQDTPTVEINQTDLKVYQSNKTVLFCMPYGYPDVKSVKWSRESGEIQATEEHFGDVSALVFESTRLADEGTYTCSVSNEMGSANSTEISMQVFLDETYCVCDCEYKEKLIHWSTIEQQTLTKEELIKLLRPELIKLAKETRLDVSNLSSVKYRRKSRKNNKQSAEDMGIVSVVVIVGVFCLAVIADMTSWRKHLRTIRLSAR